MLDDNSLMKNYLELVSKNSETSLLQNQLGSLKDIAKDWRAN